MNKLGLLGPQYTYHDIARKRFIPHYSYVYFNSFDDIFNALADNTIELALIAIKNNQAGLVANNLKVIEKRNYQIIEQFELDIHLQLGSREPNTLESIEKIFSHPMAIKETSQFFRKYSHLVFISTTSTAAAVEELIDQNDPHAAVIASQEALDHHQLLLIAQNIEDSERNTTTFALIRK